VVNVMYDQSWSEHFYDAELEQIFWNEYEETVWLNSQGVVAQRVVTRDPNRLIMTISLTYHLDGSMASYFLLKFPHMQDQVEFEIEQDENGQGLIMRSDIGRSIDEQ